MSEQLDTIRVINNKIALSELKKVAAERFGDMRRKFIHQNLAAGRWFQMSLAEQLGNVGSEVGRAASASTAPRRNQWKNIFIIMPLRRGERFEK